MKSRRFVIAILGWAMLFSLGSPAFGDVMAASDPQGDNAGFSESGSPASGRLDLASIQHSHVPSPYYLDPDYLVHTISMFSAWDNELLEPRSDVYLQLAFRHRGGTGFVDIQANPDGSLAAPVYSAVFGNESTQAGFAKAWRVDDRTVAVALMRSQIWPGHGSELRSYQWRVQATDQGDCSNLVGDQHLSCADLAPDNGEMIHVLLGPGSVDCSDDVDNDGDGLADDDDAGCSSDDDPFEGFSDAEGDCDRDRCESPAFTLRLDHNPNGFPLLRGRVRSSLKGCLSERLVYLYRIRRGADRSVTRSGTPNDGKWLNFLPDHPGRYYVVVVPVEKERTPDFVRCARIESNVVRLRP